MVFSEIDDKEFQQISSLMYECCRVNLHEGKKTLVQSRLNKRLRQLGLADFRDYFAYLREHDEEILAMVDCLTTNHTQFFRGPEHFEFLKTRICPRLRQADGERIRIWSAGCSSGEEAYTIAMVLKDSIEDLGSRDALILATDISRQSLDRARHGIYQKQGLGQVPPELRMRYFDIVEGAEPGRADFRVKEEIAKLVRFRFLNLATDWPMIHPFDVIFCRNVMIYFDRDSQKELIERFWRVLKPGGFLVVGHCESLTGMMHEYAFVQPTIYRKLN